MRCNEVFKYVGETRCTAFTRVKEHISDYRAARLPPLPTSLEPTDKRRVKSWMWEHTCDVHGGQLGAEGGVLDYRFKVPIWAFRKCLERQVDEGVRIRLNEQEGVVLMNSKNEWFTTKTVETIFRQM